MSIATDFETFCKNIKMDERTVETISTRYQSITRRLNLDFWGLDSTTSHSFYTGSYGRDTEIYTSDIDMVMVLPPSLYDRYAYYAGNGKSALLQAVKRSIEKTYPNTDVGGDGQVVQVKFSDGMMFEIVPAFEQSNGTYKYPDSNNGGSWRIMDPKSEMAAFTAMNNRCNKNLKRLCRMARAWNAYNRVGMKGILIDTLAYKFIKDYEYNDKSYTYYDWMSRDFMQFLYDNHDQAYWYVPGSNWQISRNTYFKNDARIGRDKCCEAIKYAKDNMPYSEHSKWREHYGTKYPNA